MKTRRMNGSRLEICDEDNVVVLSIDERMENDAMIITLSGSLQNDVCFEFEDELMAALLVCDKVRMDFSEVTYLASKALNTLLDCQRMVDEKNNAEMSLFNVSEAAMQVFVESGYSELLLIED